ncbi:MAG: restriction endonuclease subunit M [Pyrobaculum sp.]
MVGLGVEPSRESFDILASALHVLRRHGADFSSFSFIMPFLRSGVARLPIEECQVRVQKLLSPDVRKRFAAYYTVDRGIEFMAALAARLVGGRRVVLADPFMGSGRTLAAAVRRLGVDGVELVWGVEPLPLAALVAYAALVDAMGGRWELVKVANGDVFKLVGPLSGVSLPRADVILTNPPFTRWSQLEERYRESLLEIISGLGYGRYLSRRDPGLHILSMFLVDYLLKEGGLVVAVLPASTFYTIQGRGFRELLKERYRVLAILEGVEESFSEDSGFKEVILAAVKGGGGGGTYFGVLDDVEKAVEMAVGGGIDIRKIPQFFDLNWLALLDGGRGVEVFAAGLKSGRLAPWREVFGRNMVRGIEMYGPDFFFIPNRRWRIVSEGKDVVEVEHGGVRLAVGRQYLVKTLRRPALYGTIGVYVDSYMLAIPPTGELPRDLKRYIELNRDLATPAVRAYGERWYSHVYRQIATKRPIGHVFIPDKIDLERRGVFAHYSPEPVAASKNFYVVKTTSKLLLAWLNSTFFIALIALLGRKITDSWTRFVESDYMELPVPTVETEEIIEAIDAAMDVKMQSEHRRKIDIAIAKAIGVEEVEKLYTILGE